MSKQSNRGSSCIFMTLFLKSLMSITAHILAYALQLGVQTPWCYSQKLQVRISKSSPPYPSPPHALPYSICLFEPFLVLAEVQVLVIRIKCSGLLPKLSKDWLFHLYLYTGEVTWEPTRNAVSLNKVTGSNELMRCR